MIYYLTIPPNEKGETFISLNKWILDNRCSRFKGNATKQKEQRRVEQAIDRQLHGVKLKPPVFLSYIHYEKDTRKDKDNIASMAHKVVQDALVSKKCLKDDKWHDISGFSDSFEVDKKNPRTVVVIDEV